MVQNYIDAVTNIGLIDAGWGEEDLITPALMVCEAPDTLISFMRKVWKASQRNCVFEYWDFMERGFEPVYDPDSPGGGVMCDADGFRLIFNGIDNLKFCLIIEMEDDYLYEVRIERMRKFS